MPDHLIICPRAGSSCPFAEFGCIYKAGRETLQQHIKDEPIKHLSFLCDGVIELKVCNNHIYLISDYLFSDTIEQRAVEYGKDDASDRCA